ncbi:unnamed protein product, partial [Prorocentrum cordatum]
VEELPAEDRYNADAVAGLLRYRLLPAGELDRLLSRWVGARNGAQSAFNAQAVDFGLLLLSRAVVKHRSCSLADLPLSVEALSTQAQAMGAHTLQATAQELHLAKQALRLLEELASPQGETPRQVARAQVPTRLKERFADEERAKAAGIAAAAGPGEPIAALFEEWHDSCGTDSVSQNVVRSQVLQQISGNWAPQGDAMGRFFRSCCEAAVKRTLADPAPPASASPADEDEA